MLSYLLSGDGCMLSFRKRYGFVMLIFCCYCISCFGQNEKTFPPPGNLPYINGIISTYDSAMIIGFSNNDTTDQISNVVKYGSNNTVLWKINVRNLWIWNMISTQDSGFLIAGDGNFPHNSNDAHLPGYRADYPYNIYRGVLLKFNKCGKLLWGKYINTAFLSLCNSIVESKDGSIFGIGGVDLFNDRVRKIVFIYKLSKTGDLLKCHFFEGTNAISYYDPDGNSLYIKQHLYVPRPGDTSEHSWEYLFSGIKKLDTALRVQAQTVLGYKKWQFTSPGQLFLKKDSLVLAGKFIIADSFPYRPYFLPMNKNLRPLSSDFILDKDSQNSRNVVYPLFTHGGIAYDDSYITMNMFNLSDHPFNFFTSLRLYDRNFSLLKKIDINQEGQGVWKLPNGNFVASVDNRFLNYSSLFLFDRHLNPVAWPSKPPVKGYDWACTGSIVPVRNVDVTQGLQPLPIQMDTTRVDWSWVWYDTATSIKSLVQARQSDGWVIFPQPFINGDNLYLQSSDGSTRWNHEPWEANFYDLLGRKMVTKVAIYVGRAMWTIPSLRLPSAGLYLLRLKDRNGYSREIKVFVQ